MNRAVFLDKDGTLIEDVPYNVNPGLIRLTSGAVEGLRSLQGWGYKLIVVSNQSGVAFGYFPEVALQEVEAKIRDLLSAKGVRIEGFYYCTHHPQGKIDRYRLTCSCRKPEPGLILRAALEHNIDLANSWLIGDILNDIEAGRRAGCQTILINNGNETEWILNPNRLPHCITIDLDRAATIITALQARKTETCLENPLIHSSFQL